MSYSPLLVVLSINGLLNVKSCAFKSDHTTLKTNESIILSLPSMQRGVHPGSSSADSSGRLYHLAVLQLINPLHFTLVSQALNARYLQTLR